MMPALALFLTVVTAAAAAAATPPPAPDAAVIRVDSTTTVRVCADCQTRDVTFRVTPLFDKLLHFDPAKEVPKVVEVQASGVRDAALETLFEARWEVDAKQQPRTLRITVKPQLRTQGTYTVVVDAFPGCRPKSPRVTVQIVLPAAKLLVPAKLTIERTVRWWPFDTTSEPTSFSLRETGAVSGVKQLQADPPELSIGTRGVPGQVRVSKIEPATPSANPHPPDLLPSNSPWRAELALDGTFPLGTAAGQLRLNAPELAEAVLVPIEVKSVLSKGFLLVTIALGIFTSWWLKVFTHGVIERNTARAAAARLLQRVRADQVRYKDAIFRDAITGLATALETARAGRSATDIDKARTDLETAWSDALKDLIKRRADLVQGAKDLKELTTRAWVHPPALRQAIDVARTAADSAVALQESGDVSKATTDLTAARETLTAQAIAEGEWQREARAMLEVLASELDPRFAAISTALRANVKEWTARIALFPQTPGKADPTKLEEHLQRIDAEHREVTTSLTQTVDQLRQAVARAKGTSTSPKWHDVEMQLDHIAQLLATAPDDPAKVRAALPTEIQTLLTLLARAAQAVAKARAESDEDAGEVLSLDEDEDGLHINPFRMAGGGPGRGDRENWILLAGGIDPYAVDIAESEATVWRAKLQQSLIVGVFFVVWAVATYSPTFDGTWAGLATVFFSAFSVDVAVDSLITKMKK